MKPMCRILLICLLPIIITACGPMNISAQESYADGESNSKPVKLYKIWSKRAGSGTHKSYVKLIPAVSPDRIFTADSKGVITSHDRKNGDLVWKIYTKAPVSSGPVVSKGLLVVGTRDARILAFDANTGNQRWQSKVSNEVLAAPSMDKRHVFVKTIDGKVEALNRRNGNIDWVHDHGAPSLILRTDSSPITYEDLLVVGFADGKITAISRDTGKLRWQRTIAIPRGSSAVERLVDIGADPVIVDGVIYVVSYQGNLVAISLYDGQLLWRHKLSSFSGLAVGSDELFVSDADSRVWAFNRETGTVTWKSEQFIGRQITAPTLFGGMVVIGDNQGYLHWLSKTDGHKIADIQVGNSAITVRPKIKDKDLITITAKGQVAVYRW